jgi:hypothetical protein
MRRYTFAIVLFAIQQQLNREGRETMDKTTTNLLQALEEKADELAAAVAVLKTHLRGGEGAQPDESAEEVAFRTKIGPFLNAIDEAGGAVPAEQFGALGRRFGYDPRGLGGFATGSTPSIRSKDNQRVLTPRGRALAERWRRMAKEQASVETTQAQLAAQIGEGLPRYVALPTDSPDRAEFRFLIRDLAEKWRGSVQEAAAEPKGDAVGLAAADFQLGVDAAGLDRLTEWGLPTLCRVNMGRLVLRREIEALRRDRTWWRDLADVEP